MTFPFPASGGWHKFGKGFAQAIFSGLLIATLVSLVVFLYFIIQKMVNRWFPTVAGAQTATFSAVTSINLPSIATLDVPVAASVTLGMTTDALAAAAVSASAAAGNASVVADQITAIQTIRAEMASYNVTAAKDPACTDRNVAAAEAAREKAVKLLADAVLHRSPAP